MDPYTYINFGLLETCRVALWHVLYNPRLFSIGPCKTWGPPLDVCTCVPSLSVGLWIFWPIITSSSVPCCLITYLTDLTCFVGRTVWYKPTNFPWLLINLPVGCVPTITHPDWACFPLKQAVSSSCLALAGLPIDVDVRLAGLLGCSVWSFYFAWADLDTS